MEHFKAVINVKIARDASFSILENELWNSNGVGYDTSEGAVMTGDVS